MLKTRTLTLEADDAHVGQLTLTRPEVMNRIDQELHTDLAQALEVVRNEPDLRALVVCSTGRVFAAGGDFDLMRSIHDDPHRMRTIDQARLLFMSLIDIPIPIVIALQGDAIGLGATIVLAGDAVVARRGARISDPHVNVGLVAGDGGCVVWPAAIGMLRAKRHLLTGDPVTAEDAYAMGMVTDLVDNETDVLPTARALATRIASLPPLAVQGTKRALNHVLQERAGEVAELAFAYQAASVASADLLEAITAFKEKRPGTYAGH